MGKYDNCETPITADDMARFHRNAPAAIARREGSYAWDEFGAGLRNVILGAVPLIGLMWFDWSPTQMLLFLLVGSWIGILCDIARLSVLEKQVRAWGEAYYDDWHVWVVVDALRLGQKHAVKAFLRAKYQPWSGVFVDLAFGGISTLLICLGIVRSSSGVSWAELGDLGIWLWILGVLVYDIGFTFWEITSHRNGDELIRPVKVAVGLRGLGLFILMFVLVWQTDGFETVGSGVKNAMLVVNAAVLVWGLCTMAGPLVIRGETKWLKSYLREREAVNRD